MTTIDDGSYCADCGWRGTITEPVEYSFGERRQLCMRCLRRAVLRRVDARRGELRARWWWFLGGVVTGAVGTLIEGAVIWWWVR